MRLVARTVAGVILSRVANVYLDLTAEFNRGRLPAIISSGQAVVLHRLAIMSKDGDWIVREDAETLHHILAVLAEHDAHYRFGAPLDERWMAGGWSAHFEFRQHNLRVRTNFVTRPPRIDTQTLARLWQDTESGPASSRSRGPCRDKKNNREKDYAVIGELARLLGVSNCSTPAARVILSRWPGCTQNS